MYDYPWLHLSAVMVQAWAVMVTIHFRLSLRMLLAASLAPALLVPSHLTLAMFGLVLFALLDSTPGRRLSEVATAIEANPNVRWES